MNNMALQTAKPRGTTVKGGFRACPSSDFIFTKDARASPMDF